MCSSANQRKLEHSISEALRKVCKNSLPPGSPGSKSPADLIVMPEDRERRGESGQEPRAR